jgi:hypothetical protein
MMRMRQKPFRGALPTQILTISDWVFSPLCLQFARADGMWERRECMFGSSVLALPPLHGFGRVFVGRRGPFFQEHGLLVMSHGL